jgi:hypothetical protein
MFGKLVWFRSCQIYPSCHPKSKVVSEPSSGGAANLSPGRKFLGDIGTRERDRRELLEISTSPELKTAAFGSVVMRNPHPRLHPELSWVAPSALLSRGSLFLVFKCLVHWLFRRNFHTTSIRKSIFNPLKSHEFHDSQPRCTNSGSPPCGRPALPSKHTTYNRKVFIDSKNRRCTNTIVLRHL